MTFTLPHWLLTFSWFLEVVFTLIGIGLAAYRLAGGEIKTGRIGTPGERAFFLFWYVAAYGGSIIVLVLASRAL